MILFLKNVVEYYRVFDLLKFVEIFRKKMSLSSSSPPSPPPSPPPQPTPPCAFYHAYRRLNLFLMFIGICPFLQCKRTNRFICHPKYIQIICIFTIIYLAFVICLNSHEITKLFRTEPNLYNILKSCYFFATSYLIFLLLIPMLRKRQSHADYFNQLYQFDSIYDKFIEPPIKYKYMNRIFWIEMLSYGSYIVGKALLQYATGVYLFDSDSVIYRINTYFEQFVLGTIMIYMKNCAQNLVVRFRKVNSLLYAFLTNLNQRSANLYSNCQIDKLEKIAFMLNMLIKAQNSLQIAFGSAFVLLFTFYLFGMAFNAYQIFDDDTDESDDDNPYVVSAVFFASIIPSIWVFFDSMLRYHVLGNSVRNLGICFFCDNYD